VSSILLSLIMLMSAERSDDGARIRLIFDAPVAFAQSAAADPARLILDVQGAAAGPSSSDSVARAGLSVTRGPEPASLRIAVPLPKGTSGRATASGPEITIDLGPEPIVLSAARVGQGGIPTAPAPAQEDYFIGPEDLIEINVFELPELKTTTRVLGDGTVSLPLLGVIQAAGLTRTGFEARLRDLLQERFLLDPQVTISVNEYRSRMVSVIGAVTTPGTYQMIGPRTVLQMISEAGGLTKEAGADIFILRRTESGKVERLALDLDDLIIRGNPELNLGLEPGDVINVPIDRPIYVFVDGAVRDPGQIESKSSRPMTLLQAVARAGGLTERANLRGVHILRKDATGAQKRIPVNLREIRKGKADDIPLEDGDVIVVPETFF
jgi:polysaccharide export outer membrane protein